MEQMKQMQHMNQMEIRIHDAYANNLKHIDLSYQPNTLHSLPAVGIKTYLPHKNHHNRLRVGFLLHLQFFFPFLLEKSRSSHILY